MPHPTNLLVGCGVKPCISDCLLRQNVSFARTVEITSGMETAAKNARAHMNPMITQASSTLLTISLAALRTKEPRSLAMSFYIAQVPLLRQTATACRALKNTNAPNRGYQRQGGNSVRRGYQGQGKSRHQNVRKSEAENFVAPDGQASHDCSVGEEATCLYVVNQYKGVSQ